MARKFSFKTYSKIRYELIKAKRRNLKTGVVLVNGRVGSLHFESFFGKIYSMSLKVQSCRLKTH